MKNNSAIFLFVSALVWVLILIGFVKLLPIFTILISLIVFIYNPKKLVLLYIIFLPINEIVKKEDLIFSLISVSLPINFFLNVYLIFIRRNGYAKYRGKLNPVVTLAVFLISYLIYTGFKEAYFGYSERTFYNGLMRSLNVILVFLPVIIIFINNSKDLKQEIFDGISFGAILLGVLSISAYFLSGFDLKTAVIGGRTQGFLANGNANTLGAFYAVHIGYLVTLYKTEKGKHFSLFTYFQIVFSILIISLTQSRSAFLAMLIVFFLYLKSLKNNLLVLRLIIIIAFLFVPLSFMFEDTLNRMTTLREEQTETGITSNRIGKWTTYTDLIISDPSIIIRGSDNFAFLYQDKRTSAHNLYIQILYESGIFFLMFYFYAIIRYVRLSKSGDYVKFIIIIPTLFYGMTGSGLGIFWYVLFYIGIHSEAILHSNYQLNIKRHENFKKIE